MRKNRKAVIQICAAAYALIMLFLLFCRDAGSSAAPYLSQLKMHYNPVPFHTIFLFLRCFRPPFRPKLVCHAVINLFGNILMFLPLGFFPPLLWNFARRLWRTLLLAAAIISAVEFLQMLLLVGSCDIDDLLLNLIGTAIGYGIYHFGICKKQTT